MTKKWAVKAHLADFYEYDQRKLDELNILETKITNKDEVVYIAVEKERDIKDIYLRKAECRNENAVVKKFIPPQFWERFSAMNRICAQRRAEDSDLKTQIRFGLRDLILLTKVKGIEEPFKKVEGKEFEDFIGRQNLPVFDLSIKWKVQEDRPPRRKIKLQSRPSSRQEQTAQPATQLTRLHSDTSQPVVSRKKPRNEVQEQAAESPISRGESMDTTL